MFYVKFNGPVYDNPYVTVRSAIGGTYISTWDRPYVKFKGTKAQCLKFVRRYRALGIPVYFGTDLAYVDDCTASGRIWKIVRKSDGSTPSHNELIAFFGRGSF